VALLLGEETARLVAANYTVIELDRIIVKGRTLPSPVFTVVHKADAKALVAHQAFIEAKYAGTLAPSDPSFDRLAGDIPELAGYYAIVRDALAADGKE
jgi:adenylate cyclase